MILTPLLIMLTFLGVQAAVYFHAANVASAAASQGAVTGSRVGSGAGQAEAASRQMLSDLGVTTSANVTAMTGSEFVTVVVEVEVARIVPFFPGQVRRVAVQARERFVPESQR